MKLYAALAIALPLVLTMATETSAQETTLCDFTKWVLAERPNEFEAFKGAKTDREEQFEGTAIPNRTARCHLQIRHRYKGSLFGPKYDCTVNENLSSRDASALYERYATELGRCLSGAALTEDRSSEKGGLIIWQWEAKSAEYIVSLQNSNFLSIMRNRLLGPQGNPTFIISLVAEDLTPPRPGAAIPEVK